MVCVCVLSITIDGHVDGLADGRSDAVLSSASVRSFCTLVHRTDEQSSIGKLIVGQAERKNLVIEDAELCNITTVNVLATKKYII